MGRKAFLIWCMALLIVGAVAGGVGAQADPASPAAEERVEERSVYFPGSFQMVDGVLIAERSETELVQITLEGTVVYAAKVTYNDDEGWAELEGEVRVERDGMIVTASKATLMIDDESYIFEGDVYMNDTKGTSPRQIWADHVEYSGETGNLTARGNVRVEEEKRSFTAARMVYDAENERAELEGDVVVNDERGTIVAHRLEIDLQEGNFSGTGPGRIVLPINR